MSSKSVAAPAAAATGLSDGIPCRRAWRISRATPRCRRQPTTATSMPSPPSMIPRPPSACPVARAVRRVPSPPRPSRPLPLCRRPPWRTPAAGLPDPRPPPAPLRPARRPRSSAQRPGLPPPQTAASPRAPRQDSPLAPLARHPPRTRRDEHGRAAARGTLPDRLPEGRRLTSPRISARYGEVGQGDSMSRLWSVYGAYVPLQDRTVGVPARSLLPALELAGAPDARSRSAELGADERSQGRARASRREQVPRPHDRRRLTESVGSCAFGVRVASNGYIVTASCGKTRRRGTAVPTR